jgi:hypothetical protein
MLMEGLYSRTIFLHPSHLSWAPGWTLVRCFAVANGQMGSSGMYVGAFVFVLATSRDLPFM